MPKLIAALIRHAEYQQLPNTPSAHQPFPLTPNGETQAHQAGIKLRQLIIDNGWTLTPAIDSSQLLRAWQTAQILAEELSHHSPTPPQLTGFDDLAERGLGSANNLSIQDIDLLRYFGQQQRGLSNLKIAQLPSGLG